MNHDLDYDRDGAQDDIISSEQLISQLEQSLQQEENMMKTYLLLADKIHDNDLLKNRLTNFAEGNAKRSKQLLDEISSS